uniref:Ig-like domain-containing protein n=1 Tax=Hucho hucho TaxID=62062 RepID=A0A4W5PXN7_9TELE
MTCSDTTFLTAIPCLLVQRQTLPEIQQRNMFLTSLLLLAVLPYIHSISLTSSPAQLKAPGQSVKLSCQVSGYALTDYGTAWIRHQPGKTLEWIGIIWGGGSISSGASFKSRFIISRDSSNVLYLDITSLQAEDTAVYYCAKTRGTVQQLNGRPVQKHNANIQLTVSTTEDDRMTALRAKCSKAQPVKFNVQQIHRKMGVDYFSLKVAVLISI